MPGISAPMPSAGAEEQEEEALARFQEEVLSRLPPGLPRVCVLGGREFKNPDVTVPLIESIARQLRQFRGQIVVLTGGMPGVQEAFAKNLGTVGLYNLLPAGESSGYGVGTDLSCGRTLQERMAIFGRLGDIYLTFEGGPGVGQEATTAYTRGAMVLALRATGGASAGALPQFPQEALEKPKWASAADWELLGGADAAQVAPAVARLISTRVAQGPRTIRACCESLFDALARCTGRQGAWAVRLRDE